MSSNRKETNSPVTTNDMIKIASINSSSKYEVLYFQLPFHFHIYFHIKIQHLFVYKHIFKVTNIFFFNCSSLFLNIFSGRTLYFTRRSCCHLHNHSALARVKKICSYPLPSTLIQARHQAVDPCSGEAEGGVQCQVQVEPEPERRVGLD